MKRLACVTAAAILLVSLAEAAVNLNSSKSNAYRLTYSTTLVTSEQAAAILAELEKTPRMDEAAIKQALPALLKKNGVDPAKVKKTVVKRDEHKSLSIIILDKPEDEAAAMKIAVSDPGVPTDKGKAKKN